MLAHPLAMPKRDTMKNLFCRWLLYIHTFHLHHFKKIHGISIRVTESSDVKHQKPSRKFKVAVKHRTARLQHEISTNYKIQNR